MALVHFSKMHGNGNDFLVTDTVSQDFPISEEIVKHLADRHLGVGFDQLILIEPAAEGTGADFGLRFFNSDGSEVEQCGNGTRCATRYVYDRKLSETMDVIFRSPAGIVEACLQEDNLVEVSMGPPRLGAEDIPFSGELQQPHPLDIDGEQVDTTMVSMGNPHCVVEVANVGKAPVLELGPKLQNLESLPQSANIGFMQIVDSSTIKLRVLERGAGETLACGSGACAAVVAGILNGKLSSEVCVKQAGGELLINWDGTDKPVYMTGPAELVFQGMINLESIH